MSLNNYFLNKKQLQQRQQEEQEYVMIQMNFYIRRKSRSVKNVSYRASMLQRLENFCDNRFPDEYIQSIKSGSMPLEHIYHYKYRDRDPAKEMDSSGGIYVKSFLEGKIRAETAQTEYKSSHLDPGTFDPHAPAKTDEYWLRVDDQTKQSKPLRFGLGKRTENQRVQSVQQQQRSQMDHYPTDIKMLHYPDWKPITKDKWMSSNTLALYPNMEQGHRSEPPWPQHPVRLPHEDHKYTDGHEVVGDLSRKRQKDKEGSRPDFISTVKPDVLATNINYSQSLRTMKQDHVLNVDPMHDSFSNQKRIAYYKTALLKTKSIDHNVPYQHSNNYKGIPLQDLRPATQGKLFIKSIQHYNQTLIPNRVAVARFKEQTPKRDIPDIQIDLITSPSPVRQSSLERIQEIPVQGPGSPSLASISNIEQQKRKKLGNMNPKRMKQRVTKLNPQETQMLVEKYFTG